MSTSARPPRDPLVGAWLIAICILLIAMILLGGATRLTGSGLSITEWRPVTGAIPPLSSADWEAAFAKYRETSQFRLANPDIGLADFQILYWWEWSHRLLGRAIGVVFALPFLLFWLAGRLRGRFWACLLLFALGGLQGALGWWMVESGLAGRVAVDPIRLALHLGLAFIILALAWRLALSALAWPGKAGRFNGGLAAAFAAALFVQILLGAIMAGSGAGRAYADWPLIGGEWVPSGYAKLQPFAANLIANHAAIQFNHRAAGYVVWALSAFMALFALARAIGPPRAMALIVFGLATLQAALGIWTVTAGAPLGLSLIHQGGAVALWLATFALLRAARWR
jgi:cytochrome c oxidase assembly protein subunit 15